MADRVAISKRIRFEVFKRDQFICQYCGRHPPDITLEVDHIIPICEGGDAGEDNLLSACFDCNRGKAGIPLTAIPKGLMEKAAEIAEREEQLAGYREVVQQQKDRIDEDMWSVARQLFGDYKCQKGIRRDWLVSIKRFNKLLDFHDVLEAAEIARAKMPWSDYRSFLYFCGVCWHKVKENGEPEEGGKP